MIRRPQLNPQNSRVSMSIDYGKTQLPLATVPQTRSRSCSPIASHPSSLPPIIKPPTEKRGIGINTVSILYMITLIGIVFYSKHHCNVMRIQYQNGIAYEREQWEAVHSQELQDERQVNERLVEEMEAFTGNLQDMQQALQREQQTVESYKNEVQATHFRYQQLEMEATTSTESLKNAVQDIYRRNALRE